jgi:hypothetical protein
MLFAGTKREFLLLHILKIVRYAASASLPYGTIEIILTGVSIIRILAKGSED